MVKTYDCSGKQCAQEVADQRHHCLKAAKPNAAGTHFTQASLAGGQTLANRNCKSVHADANGQQKEFTKSQVNFLLIMYSFFTWQRHSDGGVPL